MCTQQWLKLAEQKIQQGLTNFHTNATHKLLRYTIVKSYDRRRKKQTNKLNRKSRLSTKRSCSYIVLCSCVTCSCPCFMFLVSCLCPCHTYLSVFPVCCLCQTMQTSMQLPVICTCIYLIRSSVYIHSILIQICKSFQDIFCTAY